MTAKEYLSQVYYLDKMIDAKIEQQQHLKDLAYKVSPTLSAEKVSGGSIENRTEDYICKWVDLDNEITTDIDRLVELKKEIKKVIEQVHEPKYKLLLTLRYLNCKKFEEIAEEMNFKDVRWVYELHKKALNFIEVHVLIVV